MRSEGPGDVLGVVFFVFDFNKTFAMRALEPDNGPGATSRHLWDLPAASGRIRRRLGLPVLEIPEGEALFGLFCCLRADLLFACRTLGMLMRKR
jgi:hypothetical protein